MDRYASSTAKIVAIQHELILSIGLDLELDKMLHVFLQTCLLQLDLESVHVYLYDDPKVGRKMKHFLSLPESNPADTINDNSKVVKANALRPVHYCNGQQFDLTYPLKNIGVIILRRTDNEFNEALSYSLFPVMDRLAISCQACLDHQKVIDEVAARKSAERALIDQAYRDPLTKLPNRKMLYEQLQETIENLPDYGGAGAVLSVDIARFKDLNDTLGHTLADEVLLAVKGVLLDCLRDNDFVARKGSDEFVLIATCQGRATIDCNAAKNIAERILKAFKQPLILKELKLHVSLCIGISLFPEHLDESADSKTNSENLLKFADTALKTAKQQGRSGWALFHPNMQAQSDTRLVIEKHLRNALANHELEMHYQPIIAPNGNIIGGEALLRWTNAELGRVSPADFIPIAEERGLIGDIGKWTIEDACRLVAQIRAKDTLYPHFQYLSVNVSPRQFKQPNFADSVIKILQTSDINPHNLRLEVTEGIAIDNVADTIKKMQKLQDYGVKFSLDDFGTGYSSLSYLHKLPLHTIKIDQSFVTDINHHPENQAIVDATVAMAEHMGKYCVIEGVETQEDLDYFSNTSINAMQGYYFSHPVPEEHFLELLREGSVFDEKEQKTNAKLAAEYS